MNAKLAAQTMIQMDCFIFWFGDWDIAVFLLHEWPTRALHGMIGGHNDFMVLDKVYM